MKDALVVRYDELQNTIQLVRLPLEEGERFGELVIQEWEVKNTNLTWNERFASQEHLEDIDTSEGVHIIKTSKETNGYLDRTLREHLEFKSRGELIDHIVRTMAKEMAEAL